MTSSRIPYIATVVPNDWNTIMRFSRDVQKYISTLAKSDQTVYMSELYLTGTTASRLLATDASQKAVSTDLASWVTGTANEIEITDDGDGTITVGIINPLVVAKGGTGAATLTDGGILLGSGTGAITALGQATNGQLPIGSTGVDSVLGTITGTSNQLIVTNAAGSITLSTPQDIHTGATPQFAGLGLGTALTAGYILELAHTTTGTQSSYSAFTTSGNASKFGVRNSQSGTITGSYYSATDRCDSSVVTDSGPFVYDASYGLRTLGTKGYYAVVGGSGSIVNSGFSALAFNGDFNVGACGTAGQDRATTVNIGLMGAARNNHATVPKHIGVLATLRDVTATPTFTSAALVADNGDSTSAIFIAEDNNTVVFTIADGGAITGKSAKFGDQGVTNYIQFAADGELNLFGTARVWKDVELKPASVKLPGSNPPVSDNIDNFEFHRYDRGTEESVFYSWVVPEDFAAGDGSVKGHYMFVVANPPSGANENVRLGFEYKRIAEGAVFDFSSGTSSGYLDETIVDGETAFIIHITPDGTCTTTDWAPHDTILFRFYRDATAAEDTYDNEATPADNDVWIMNYHLEYLSDKLGAAS